MQYRSVVKLHTKDDEIIYAKCSYGFGERIGAAPRTYLWSMTRMFTMKTYLKPVDIELMERTAGCLRDRLLIRLLFRLGCRVSEALALNVNDIDFERGTVTILHLKTRIRLLCTNCKARLGKRHQFCPGCGEEVNDATKRRQEQQRMRVLPLDKPTLGMLEDYISRNWSTFRSDSALVFRLNRHRAWQIVRDCAKRAGLPDLVNPETGRVRGISPHRLRDA